MTVDPIEQLVDNNIVDNDIFAEQDDTEYVEYIDPTVDWNNRRDQMAADMWMRVSINVLVIGQFKSYYVFAYCLRFL